MDAYDGLVLAPSVDGDANDAVVGGCVVKRFLTDDGDSWKMWYAARDPDFDPDVVQISTGRIHFATSEDGVHWKREGPVLTENKDDWWWFDTAHVGLGDVSVMSSEKDRTGGVAMYWCYFFGGDNDREGEDGPKGTDMQIGLAISSDGLNWGRVEGEHPSGAILRAGKDGEFDANFVGWPQVIMHGDRDYRLYYHTITPEGKYVVGAAKSSDGVKFSKIGPVFEGGPKDSFDARGAGARHIIETPDNIPARYLMFYEAVSDAGVHSIGLAKSNDGLKWERASDKPVFEPSSEEGAWDAGAVGRPYLVSVDGKNRLYYYGQSGKGSGAKQDSSGIGLAENDGTGWFTWKRHLGSATPLK